jgi:nucleoid-associated protein YgaU
VNQRDSTSRRRGFIPSAQAVGVLICLVLFMLAAMSLIGSNDLHTTETTTYVVQPGDTLWNIAQSVDKHHDTRAVVREIERLSGLGSAEIYPGQTLVIPKGR